MRLIYQLWYKFGTPPWVMGGRPELVKLVEDGALTPVRALDLGCGTGGNVNWPAAQGVEAIGVDFARSAIDRAQTEAEETGSGALFFVDDITKLETVSGTFDLIIDYGTIDDLNRSARASCATRINELVSPGSNLLMYCFDWNMRWWERVLAKILPLGDGVIQPDEVRDNTKTCGSFCFKSRLDSNGSANAAVLPVPVCASPSTSLPSNNKGMVCAWIGVGFS